MILGNSADASYVYQRARLLLPRVALTIACAVWALAGVSVLAVDAFTHRGDFLSSDPMLFGLLLILVVAYLRIELPFGQRKITICPDGQPMLLAVLFLAPREAILIALLSSLVADILDHDGWLVGGFNTLSAASSTAVTALGIHYLFPDVQASSLLAPALIAAITWDLVYTFWFGAFMQVRRVGSALEFYGWARNVLGYQIALSVAAVLVAGPFVDQPVLMAALLVVLLGITSTGLKIANNEQLQAKRNEYMLDTFSRYVPSDIVRDNLEEMQEIRLGGESRDITVLFCDIRGFTSWSEDKKAEEIITELNSLLTQLGDSVMDTQGTLDKYIGDGLMAFWGAPLEQPDHADRACRAALWMLQRLDMLNDERAKEGKLPFAIGIGVHTGSAVVGNVGHERRLDYTAIGDTVNTAARLESATKEIGSVLAISAQTVEELSEDLRERALHVGPISVKGRQRPVDVWALQPLRHHGLSDPFSDDPADLAA